MQNQPTHTPDQVLETCGMDDDTRRVLTTFVRRSGLRGSVCTGLIIDPAAAVPTVDSHSGYGMMTCTGKWYAGATTLRWAGRGSWYEGAKTVIRTPSINAVRAAIAKATGQEAK